MKTLWTASLSGLAVFATAATSFAQGAPPPESPPAAPAPVAQPSVPSPDATTPPPAAAPVAPMAPPAPPALPPPPAPPPMGMHHAPPPAPASGFVLQSRLDTGLSLASSLVANPGFMVGYRAGSTTFGLGFGYMRLSVGEEVTRDAAPSTTPGAPAAKSVTTEDTTTLSAFQLLPTVMFDLWNSADERVRMNAAVSLGYARVQVTEEYDNGTKSSEDKESIDLLPVRVGVGGDFFLHPNFALGAELGLQGLFLVGSSADEGSSSETSANFNATYAALRATVVIGE